MNSGARLLAALVLVLAVLSLAALDGRPMALAMPILAYLGAGILARPEKAVLDVKRSLSVHRAGPGVPVEVRLHVRNAGSALEEILFEDGVPSSLEVAEGCPRFFTSLPAGAAVEWTYTVRGGRGEHAWGGLRVESDCHCGTTGKISMFPVETRLSVLPSELRLPRIAIRPRQTRGFAGPVYARAAGTGILMYGVREYRMGDPLRRMNWRLSSRDPRTVFANEFEQERVADIGIVVDARAGSYAHPASGALFEAVVTASASLAERFLADGNRVALLVYGHTLDRVAPGYGRRQREKIRLCLASACTGVNYAMESLEHLPTRLFPARSQLVLVSPLQPGDSKVLRAMRGLGYSILVVSPDPGSMRPSDGGRPPSALATRIVRLERTTVVAALRRAGLGVADWKLDGDPSESLHSALERNRVGRCGGPPS